MDSNYPDYPSTSETIQDRRADQARRKFDEMDAQLERVDSMPGHEYNSPFAHPISDEQMKHFYVSQWNDLAMDPSQLQLNMTGHTGGPASVPFDRSTMAMAAHDYQHHDESGQAYAACSPDCDEECKSQCGEAGELDVCADPSCDEYVRPCTNEDCKEPTCDDAECLATCSVERDDQAAAEALASIGGGSQTVPSPLADDHLSPTPAPAPAQSHVDPSPSNLAGNPLLGNAHGGTFMASGNHDSTIMGQDLNFDFPPLPPDLGMQLNLLGDAVLHHLPTAAPHMRPCPWDKQPTMTQICRFPRSESYNQSMDLGSLATMDQSSLCGVPFYGYQELLDHCSASHPLTFNQVQSQYLQRLNMNGMMGTGFGAEFGHPSGGPFGAVPDMAQARAETVTPSAVPSPIHSTTPGTRDSVESFSSPGAPQDRLICKWKVGPGKVCGQAFDTEQELHAHAVAHSKGLKKTSPFQCLWAGCTRSDDTSRTFSQRSKLERHLQTHSGYKPFVCSVCNLPLSGQQALTQHMRTHTQEKPWACKWPGCDKAFKAQSALKMHERTHTGEKGLRCPICQKAFSESSNLSKHKKTHAREFQCHVCEKQFSRNDQLKNHMKTQHPDAMSEPAGPEGSVLLHRTSGGRVAKATA